MAKIYVVAAHMAFLRLSLFLAPICSPYCLSRIPSPSRPPPYLYCMSTFLCLLFLYLCVSLSLSSLAEQ